jgi:hypothetical protein
MVLKKVEIVYQQSSMFLLENVVNMIFCFGIPGLIHLIRVTKFLNNTKVVIKMMWNGLQRGS